MNDVVDKDLLGILSPNEINDLTMIEKQRESQEKYERLVILIIRDMTY